MSGQGEGGTMADGWPAGTRDVLRVLAPERQTRPLVLASPHSGTTYPPEFLALSRLSLRELRSSEDTHVETIFADAPRLGVPLLCALLPRVYLDVNREPMELDPSMFSDPLPARANTDSPRVRAGLGTVPRVAGDGQHIYRRKVPYAEAERRIRTCYDPYHAALRRLIAETRTLFGHCVILDCHSMPASAVSGSPPRRRPDIVLGDRHGTSCDAAVIDAVEGVLTRRGYRVQRNAPYAGGFTTRHYGRPAQGVHALQIEINRALYMDEVTRVPTPGLARLAAAVPSLLEALSSLSMMPRAAE